MPAVKSLGFCCAPPVKHDQGWRDRKTGFHSNDCEGENNRLKTWLRSRYTTLKLTFKAVVNAVLDAVGPSAEEIPPADASDADDEALTVEPLDLYEYAFYVNVGNSMSDVMRARLVDCPVQNKAVFTSKAYGS